MSVNILDARKNVLNLVIDYLVMNHASRLKNVVINALDYVERNAQIYVDFAIRKMKRLKYILAMSRNKLLDLLS